VEPILTWAEASDTAYRLIGYQPVILIVDEFPYAAESDPWLPSNLQAAWDHHFNSEAVGARPMDPTALDRDLHP
jgi:hypothetical protein